MKLPIDNKKRAQAYSLSIIFLIISIGSIIYLNNKNINTIFASAFIIVLWLFGSLVYYKNQNIKEAYIKDGFIIVKYRNKSLQVPIKNISDITKGFSYWVDLSGKISFTFILNFKNKYLFGRKLFMNFKANKDLIEDEPNEIKFLRTMLK